ncbi:hypothetical protein Bpro_3611 [Polaromonas sp. JS666]|nr:hypothetical protein Bpro_3611 [Polaromonas sp. JS666]
MGLARLAAGSNPLAKRWFEALCGEKTSVMFFRRAVAVSKKCKPGAQAQRPLGGAEGHTQWANVGPLSSSAGAAGLALPDRRRSGPLGEAESYMQ